VIAPRACLTERARQWAFEQVGDHDAAVSRVAAGLGVAWWAVMNQVIARGIPLVEDPARLHPPVAPTTVAGVDETAFVRATGTHPTLFATDSS
jgi:transposase